MDLDPFEDEIRRAIAEQKNPRKPRLRFDRVALSLLRSVKEDVNGIVPSGRAVVFTITAPIRLPSKSAAAITQAIQSLLASGEEAYSGALHGNQVRVRIVPSADASIKVLGFVHNPDPGSSAALVEMVKSLLSRGK